MKYYMEITLLSNAEIPLHFLWEKVYQQLHLALVENSFDSDEIIRDKDGQEEKIKKSHIAVSFPKYGTKKHPLGSQLRLMAYCKKELEQLNTHKWLSLLHDYLHISSIRDVPDKIEGYACFRRLQPKSNNARLARRKAKREKLSLEQATACFESRQEVYSHAPYIYLQSQSSNQRFRLMIVRMGKEQPSAKSDFSTYGLSSTSTVPIFK